MAEARSQLARQRSSPHGVVVGSVGGFQISLDYSWFVIFFLIFGTFTSAVFPAYIPGLSQQSYLLMGIVGTVLAFASLLAHELAHVARALGIPVEGITLFIFGGMARTPVGLQTLVRFHRMVPRRRGDGQLRADPAAPRA